jgi:hypothetical protein
MKHTINFNKVKYVLSREQYFMLTKSTVAAKAVLHRFDRARMKGLVSKGLFYYNGLSYKRTDLGNDLLRAFKQRDKTKEVR